MTTRPIHYNHHYSNRRALSDTMLEWSLLLPTWKDLMNVHSNIRILSPRLNNLTSLITRNKRKKLILMNACLSSCISRQCTVQYTIHSSELSSHSKCSFCREKQRMDKLWLLTDCHPDCYPDCYLDFDMKSCNISSSYDWSTRLTAKSINYFMHTIFINEPIILFVIVLWN